MMIKTLQKIIVDTVKAMNPVQVRYGTIANINPLSVTLEDTLLTVTAPSVYISSRLQEKVIDKVEHSHSTSEGSTDTKLSDIQCYQNGVPLGYQDGTGKIIINKGLAIGDKVILIRHSSGQRYLIIDKVV